MSTPSFLPLVTVAAIVAGTLTAAGPASASEATSTPAKFVVPQDLFVARMDERSVLEPQVNVEAEGVNMAGRFDDVSHEAFDLTIDDNGTGQFSTTDEAGQRLQYDLDIDTATPDRLEFVATDPRTGETFHYDSAAPMKRIAFVIPVAFAAVSVATALYYLAIGAAIVVAGMLALEAGKAIGKIVAANNRKPAKSRRNYYPAYRRGDSSLMILPRGWTKAQAMTKARARHDVWALSATLAKALARDLNKSGKPIGPERHKGGVRHYHPFKHAPNMHSFFGGHP